MSRRRDLDREIIDALTAAELPLTVREIAEGLNPQTSVTTVRNHLNVMAAKRRVEKAGVAFDGGRCWKICEATA